MTPGHDSLSAMEQACAAGLVDEQAAGTYAFRHAVIRDAVDEALSRSRRADLHRRAADAIEERAAGTAGAHLCDIAEHRCAATPPADPAVALAASRAAAAWAMAHHAYDRATVVLHAHVAVLPRDPGEPLALGGVGSDGGGEHLLVGDLTKGSFDHVARHASGSYEQSGRRYRPTRSASSSWR
jgi:hypothetical protein